jgi:hypothetical protein
MRIETKNGYRILTLGYSDITSEGQNSINEGYAPSINEADIKSRELLSEADVVVFQDKGLFTIMKTRLNESESFQLLGF